MECLPRGTRDHVSQLDFTLQDNGWLSTSNLSCTIGEDGFPSNYFIATGNQAFPNISIPAECVYLYDGLDTDGAVQRFLGTYLNGTVGIEPDAGYDVDYAGAAQLLLIWNNANLTFEDLSSTFANISDSLTTYIRQNSPQKHSSPVHGAVLQEQTCVQVRWAWLAYPLALIALTLNFLMAVIVETRRGEGKHHDWKSNPLAMMFHGLDEQTIKTTQAGRLVRSSDMMHAAQQVRVRLARNENGGWGFLGEAVMGQDMH
jgi:hypothetical protein